MGTGKKKIEIKKIEKDTARRVTFSKRRQGLFKKAHQFAAKTGSRVAVLVFSPTGKPFVEGSPCFDTVIEEFVSCHCQDGAVDIGGDCDDTDKAVIGVGKLLNDYEEVGGQEGAWTGGECSNGGGGGGGGGGKVDRGRDVWEMFSGLEERMTSSEMFSGQDVWENGGGGGGGGGGEGDGGRDVLEMFSGLEERMRSSESVEELMEVKSVLVEMREKVLKRLNYMQEDDFVASLLSCDFADCPPPDHQLQ